MSQNKKQNKTKYKVTTQSSSEAQAIYAMLKMEKQRKANNPPTIITEDIAFVTAIKGVCNAGVTLHTT